MEENYKYLNEEKYQRAEKKITFVGVCILLLGLCIGGYLIYCGVAKPGTEKLEELKVELENKKAELINSGVSYSNFTKYSDGKAYELMIISKALDPSFNHCDFDEYKDNAITKDYCRIKNRLSDFTSTSFIMIGAFVAISGCMIGGFILMIAKGRKIAAFGTQQAMPIAQEGIEKMAPSVGKAAKEISKGVKEGIDDEW